MIEQMVCQEILSFPPFFLEAPLNIVLHEYFML